MTKILSRSVERLGLNLPSIGQGTMGIGGYFERDSSRDTEWINGLRRGIDLGLTLFDTAEVYGAGHSEELVGEATQGVRDQVFISTKFPAQHSRASQIVAAAEQSLRRLRTDHIDLYQPHWPNPSIPFEETAEALEALLRSGKIRFVGLSNFSSQEARQAMAILDPIPVLLMQHEYNLIDRTIEDCILPDCRKRGAKVLAYSPFLQGKMVPQDGRKGVLDELSEKYRRTVAQIILAWLLRDEAVVVIPKGSTGTHLEELAAAIDLCLDSDDSARISDIYRSQIFHIPVSQISVQGGCYETEEEALKNPLGFNPSPQDLARSILAGNFLKPIKVQKSLRHNSYSLTEGTIRYWAWVLAYESQSSIPAFVESRDGQLHCYEDYQKTGNVLQSC